ncbi:unnamed protein product [Closterium sp. Naga37s-1]|nr:unnamed protein product [Closterium sp. Naga37s-1]
MALAARSPSDGLLAGKSAGRRALPVLRQAPVSLLCAVDSAASKRVGFHEASNSAVFKAKTSLSAADLLMLLSPTVASSANIGAINGGPYACRECSNKFPSLHSLDFHYQTYHSKDKKSRLPVGHPVGGSNDSEEPAGSGSAAPRKSGTPPPPRVAGRRAHVAASQETLGESGSAASAAAASQSQGRSPSLSPSPSATTIPSSGAGEDVAAAGAMAAATGAAKTLSQQRRGAKRNRADSQPGGANPSAPATKRGGRRCGGAASEKFPGRVMELGGCAAGAQIATMDAGRAESIKVESQRLGRPVIAGKKWQPPSVLVTSGADKSVGDVGRDGGALTPSDTSALQPRRIGALAGSCLTLTDRMNSLTSSLTDLTAAGSNPVSPTTPTTVPLFGGASGGAANGGGVGAVHGGGFNGKAAAQASQLQQLMALVMQEQEKRGRLVRKTEHTVTEQRVERPEPHCLQPQRSVATSDAKGITSLNALWSMQPPNPTSSCQAQRPSPANPSLATVRQVITNATSGAPGAGSPSFPALARADGRQGPGDVAGSQLSMLVAVLASSLGQQKAPVAAGEGAVMMQECREMELLNCVKGQGIAGPAAMVQCREVDLSLRLHHWESSVGSPSDSSIFTWDD